MWMEGKGPWQPHRSRVAHQPARHQQAPAVTLPLTGDSKPRMQVKERGVSSWQVFDEVLNRTHWPNRFGYASLHKCVHSAPAAAPPPC